MRLLIGPRAIAAAAAPGATKRIAVAAAVATMLLAGCAGQRPQITAAEGRALIASHLPGGLSDKEGWAADIYTPMAVLELPLTPDNICAIVAVTEQESGFRADPPIPNLAKITWAEIERRREKAGVPSMVLDAALAMKSKTGATFRERLDAATTERQLSDLFEEMIDRVPLGRTFFAGYNPVRTGGPMQVSVAFATAHAKAKRYPYPAIESIRDEVFTRRGGMYFGIAHLLDYPASYDRYRYRYADYNAGHYASRNAAFQEALASISEKKLVPDGDLRGETEAAASAISGELGIDAAQVRRDLERKSERDFEQTALYRRVFELADRRAGKPLARAVVPTIELSSPKITRKLTTAWFADRVVARHRHCLMRFGDAAGGRGY
jgi:hypothetical protein